MTAMFPDLGGHWYAVSDGDPRVAAMYARHYSYRPYRDNRRRMGKQLGFAWDRRADRAADSER